MTDQIEVTEAVRRKANRAAQRARKRGLLVQEPCQTCGEPETEMHHDDYSKPLDVRWLCYRCHCRHHDQMRNPKFYAWLARHGGEGSTAPAGRPGQDMSRLIAQNGQGGRSRS